MQEIVAFFVDARKDNAQDMTAEDLHAVVTLARQAQQHMPFSKLNSMVHFGFRLLSLSHGKCELTKEVWEKATRMEKTRRERISRAQ